MRFFRWCAIFLLLIFPSVVFSAKSKSSAAPDGDYVFALSAADRFLQSWESGDSESGIVMLTDAAKQSISEERLDELFSPQPPGQRAYEVLRGKKLAGGRYSFAVALFEAGGKARTAMPHYSKIVVVRESKDDWVIDRLPQP